MNDVEQRKLKHDVMNSIVVIHSMSKSASSFLSKLSNCMAENEINPKQMEVFLNSMNIIREQTAKIETYFQTLFNELRDN